MHACLNPFSFLVVSVAGWMNQHQQHVIEYLTEENRVLREQIGNRRMRFTDNQRCREDRKASLPCGPPPRMKRLAFDRVDAYADNKGTKRNGRMSQWWKPPR